jgi:hypothetical protein
VRVEASVTSVTWLPQGAIEGIARLPFDVSVAHYDKPPPDRLEDLDSLLGADAIRFANELRAWVEVEEGRIVAHGHRGGGRVGATTLRVGSRGMVFPAVGLPDLRPEPEVRETAVRFVQTAGGRTGVAVPRRVRRPPYVQVAAPTAWTTLALTIEADGTSRHEVVGASSFPRHWIYDNEKRLRGKTGVIDYDTWYREAFGPHTPWGDHDSPAIVTAVESELERELSVAIIGSHPPFRRLRRGEPLCEQGDPGRDELFLLFDGVLQIEMDGDVIAEVGPGAILGEMAVLEDGRRTATLRAVTTCRVAVVPGADIDRRVLAAVARSRRGPQRPS